VAENAQTLVFVIQENDWPKYVAQLSRYFGYSDNDMMTGLPNPETQEQFVVRMISQWMVGIVNEGEKQDAADALDIPPIVIGTGGISEE